MAFLTMDEVDEVERYNQEKAAANQRASTLGALDFTAPAPPPPAPEVYGPSTEQLWSPDNNGGVQYEPPAYASPVENMPFPGPAAPSMGSYYPPPTPYPQALDFSVQQQRAQGGLRTFDEPENAVQDFMGPGGTYPIFNDNPVLYDSFQTYEDDTYEPIPPPSPFATSGGSFAPISGEMTQGPGEGERYNLEFDASYMTDPAEARDPSIFSIDYRTGEQFAQPGRWQVDGARGPLSDPLMTENIGVGDRNTLGDLFKSYIPEKWTEKLPNPWWFPAEDIVEGATSPIGIATMPFGGLARNALAEVGANVAGRAFDKFAPESAQPLKPLAYLAGGIGGNFAPEIGEGLAKGGLRIANPVASMDDVSRALSPVDEFGVGLPRSVPKLTDLAPAKAPTRDIPFGSGLGEAALAPVLKLANLAPEELGRLDAIDNFVRGVFNQAKKVGEAEPAVAAIRNAERVAENQAVRLGSTAEAAVKGAFDVQPNGLVKHLDLSVQDIAARLPKVWNLLTDDQRAVMTQLRDEVAPFARLWDEAGVEHGLRPDVVDGGFYLPRGRAAEEGLDLPVKMSGRSGMRGVKTGAEKAAVFDSMAEGVKAGWEYAPFGQVMEGYAKDTIKRAVDVHAGNYLKQFGETATDRMLRQNPGVRVKHEALMAKLASLKGAAGNLDTKTQRAIDDFQSGLNPNLDDLADAVRAARIGRGVNVGKAAGQLRQEMAQTRTLIREMAPDWRKAVEKARSTPQDQNSIAMANLSGYTFPIELANRMNSVIEGMGPLKGGGSVPVNIAKAVNNLLRGVSATGDLSLMGLQGALGAVSHPVAYGKAMGLSLKTLADPQVAGKHLADFDKNALKNGLPTSRDWARVGARIGASNTEFQIGGLGRVSSAIGKAPVIKQTNRAFGVGGDILRLEVMNAIAKASAGKGVKLTDDELREIASIGNLETGFSTRRFGGSVGELTFFAPRFMQSQLEFVMKAVTSGGIQGTEARRALASLIGLGTAGVFLANELNDEPFSWKELTDPTSGNFMRMRIGGLDVSPFGTWDSLAKALYRAGTGDPQYLLRTKASPLVSHAWDLLTGENFLGEKMNLTSADGMANFLRSLAPFGLQNVGQEPLVKTLLGATGVKSSELSQYEKRNQELRDDPEFDQYRLPGKGNNDYNNLNTLGQEKARAQYGVTKSRDPEIAERAERASAIRDKARREQEQDDQLLSGMDPRLVRGGGFDGDGAGQIDLAEWKERRTERQIARSAELRGLYGEQAPIAARDAIGRYYDALDAAQGQGGTVDFDKVEEWMLKQPPADQALIETWLGSRGTAKEQELYRERKAIADSGYFDLEEGKADWRRANPQVDALIRKWGYSETTTKAMDLADEYDGYQRQHDAKLTAGAITPEKWRENYSELERSKRDKLDVLYADLPARDQGLLGAYYGELDENAKRNGNIVNWAEMDRYVKGQTGMQAALDARPDRTSNSKTVERFTAAREKIAASGYWDIDDRVTAKVAAINGLAMTEGQTAQEYWGAISQEVFKRVLARGYSEKAAFQLTSVVMTKIMKPYTDVAAKVRNAFEEQQPEVADEIYYWGYADPSKKERAAYLQRDIAAAASQ